MEGWIKLYRSLRNWQWYDDHNATRLLVHLLLSVNYEDKKWRGILIPAGSLVCSWETLSKESKLSIRQCRTAMTKIENSGEATRVVTNRFQLISLVKWEELQSNDKQATGDKSSKRQSNDKQATTTKETIIIKRTIEERMAEFKNSLQPFLEEFGSGILNEFYLYWTEKKPKGRKMKFEMQQTFDISRRLHRWRNNNFGNKEKSSSKKETINRQSKEVIENNASDWLPPTK